MHSDLQLYKTSILEKLFDFFSNKADDHVRLSAKGRQILDNKELATKVANAIINGHTRLEKGQSIPIEGTEISINLVTAIENTK